LNSLRISQLAQSSEISVVCPVLKQSQFLPRRYLARLPMERLHQCWQDELADAMTEESAMFVADASGRTAGFCLVGTLPWESGILGKRMAAIKHIAASPGEHAARVSAGLVERAVAHARKTGYEFLSCKAHTNDMAVVHALERAGFLLVDTLLDFVVDLSLPEALRPPPVLAAGTTLRIADPSDRDELVSVASSSFATHSGRFQSDPRIEPDRGREIYEQWIQACLDGWADWVVVADVDGRIAGYSAWKRPSDPETRHRIGLGHYSIGAVHPDFAGRGIFRALTHRGTTMLAGLATAIEGPTQVNNHLVQKAYQTLGWRVADARHSFHRWLDA
jgi:GNAT superfamily N-acetyltransferase